MGHLTWHYLNLLKLLLRGSQSKYSTMEITSETLHIDDVIEGVLLTLDCPTQEQMEW